MALGEMAKLLLTGRRVSNDKVKSLGFKFSYQNLENAIKAPLNPINNTAIRFTFTF
jgi:NAD dependent epimerase/dehydratase family enzyme